MGGATLTDLMTIFRGWNTPKCHKTWHKLATLSTLRVSKKNLLMCKNVLTSAKNCLKKATFCRFYPLKVALKQIITTNLVKTIFFYCYGVLSKKKNSWTVKFITSAPPYRLKNLKTRISGFAKNSILTALEHLFFFLFKHNTFTYWTD